MEDKQKLIEKVQKLLALAQSGNRHEAEAAAAKAQEMLQKHNLEMAEVVVTKAEEERFEIIMTMAEERKDSMENWRQFMGQAVGSLTGTKFATSGWYETPRWQQDHKGKHHSRFYFIGTATDVAVACELFKYLSGAAWRLSSARELRKQDAELAASIIGEKGSATYAVRRNFCEGFAMAIWDRARNSQKAFDAKQEQAGNQSYALMVVGKEEAIKQYTQVHLTKGRSGGNTGAYSTTSHVMGWNQGQKADIGTEHRLE